MLGFFGGEIWGGWYLINPTMNRKYQCYIPKLSLTSIRELSDEGVHMELLASFVLKEILRELEKDMEPSLGGNWWILKHVTLCDLNCFTSLVVLYWTQKHMIWHADAHPSFTVLCKRSAKHRKRSFALIYRCVGQGLARFPCLDYASINGWCLACFFLYSTKFCVNIPNS